MYNGHVRNHRRTRRNTTYHHPSTHSDKDTDPKRIKSLHFRTRLDQSSQLFVSCFGDESWQLLIVPKFGDAGVGDVGGCHHQGLQVAWRQCSSACAATQQRRDPGPRHVGDKQQLLTPELWDEIREGGNERISAKMVSNRFTVSRTCPLSALASHWSSAQCPNCRTLTSVIVATSLRDVDVICFSDEKIFES